MPPKLKLHLVSAAYCAYLISQNRFTSMTRSGGVGILSEATSPWENALMLSGAIAIFLTLLCVWKARWLLERGGKIREGRWIQSYSCLLYSLPLLWHQYFSSTSVDADGISTVVRRGYGNEFSVRIFCFAVLGLLLLQIATRLSGPKQLVKHSSPSTPTRLQPGMAQI